MSKYREKEKKNMKLYIMGHELLTSSLKIFYSKNSKAN